MENDGKPQTYKIQISCTEGNPEVDIKFLPGDGFGGLNDEQRRIYRILLGEALAKCEDKRVVQPYPATSMRSN